MQRKKTIIAIVAVLLVVGLVGAWLLRNSRNSSVKGVSTVLTLKAQVVGLTVQRDSTLVQKIVNNQDQAAGQLWVLTQPASNQHEFLIDANYEQGASLKKLTGYTNQPLRDSVVANVNLQLPRQYPKYKEITQRSLAINGIDASETIFEYDSQGVKIRQRLVLLFKNSDTAVYIRAQAKADEYGEVNSRYFEPLFSSAKFE